MRNRIGIQPNPRVAATAVLPITTAARLAQLNNDRLRVGLNPVAPPNADTERLVFGYALTENQRIISQQA